jgi:peptidoglycan/xylan/chitin deacetylase (PgdA/CDA1 family)
MDAHSKPVGRGPRVKLRRLVAQTVKDIMGRLLVGSGLHRRLLRGNAIVVAFHSITPEQSDGALRCSVKDFERYCAFFARHLKTEAFASLITRLNERGPLDGQVTITFDDGYADNAELALPVLSRWSLPATFFVATGFMETRHQTFWDQDAGIESRWMSWPQVLQLSRAGHEIGAHTVVHADLGKLSAEETERELRQSRDEIQARTGTAPIHFAVPFGRTFQTQEQAMGIARDLGFKSFSLCRGGIVTPAANPMLLERWPVAPGQYLSPYGWIVDVIRAVKAA